MAAAKVAVITYWFPFMRLLICHNSDMRDRKATLQTFVFESELIVFRRCDLMRFDQYEGARNLLITQCRRCVHPYICCGRNFVMEHNGFSKYLPVLFIFVSLYKLLSHALHVKHAKHVGWLWTDVSITFNSSFIHFVKKSTYFNGYAVAFTDTWTIVPQCKQST